MLEALGNLGDFIGGIAVIVTIVYLAIQIRHNTAALQTASRQEIVAGFREYNRQFQAPGLSDAFAKRLSSYPDMDQLELNRFSTQINDLTLFFQGVLAMHEGGNVEDETCQAYLSWVASCLSTPGGRAWWSEISPFYTPRMAQAIDERLARDDLPDITQLRMITVSDAPPAASP